MQPPPRKGFLRSNQKLGNTVPSVVKLIREPGLRGICTCRLAPACRTSSAGHGGAAAGPPAVGGPRFASTFRSSSEALLGIVNGSLDYSKIEAGRWSWRKCRSTASRAAYAAAAHKGLELTYHIDDSVRSPISSSLQLAHHCVRFR